VQFSIKPGLGILGLFAAWWQDAFDLAYSKGVLLMVGW